MKDPYYEKGIKLRREILGDAYVDAGLKNADRYSMPLQHLATSVGWGMVWSRPGLSRKLRSVANLSMLVALNRDEELELHINTALRNGLTRTEISEVLLQTAVYCGFPAALGAFRTMRRVFAAADAEARPKAASGSKRPTVRTRKR